MSTLEEKAKEYYKKVDPENSDDYDLNDNTDYWLYAKEEMIKFASDFASQQVKEALERAAEKATIKREMYYEDSAGKRYQDVVDKSSILSLIKEY